MKPLITWLETSFSPSMAKVNSNAWIVALKDSIMQVLPFIFVGSLFAMLAILNDVFPGLPSFWVPFGWTMGLISLFVAFLIPFNLMERKRFRKQRLIAGLSSVSLFLIIISPAAIKDGTPGFTHSALGAGGMFTAMIAGLFTGFIMSLFAKFSFFKEDSVIPDFVRAWFDAMLPVGIVVVVGWIFVDILSVDVYGVIQLVFSPLAGIIESPWGFALMCFLLAFVYSLGISAWILTPVIAPVMLAAMQANMDGTGENLVTNATLYSTYLFVGGVSTTLPLVVLMAFSKAKRLKALGRASLIPGIFNINEPIVFGAVVWNPILMVPMWLQGIILPLIVWLFTKTIPFAPIPMYQFELWYMPFPISTWLTTGSVQALVLLAIVVAMSTVIWYPFFRAYERQTLITEGEADTNAEAETARATTTTTTTEGLANA